MSEVRHRMKDAVLIIPQLDSIWKSCIHIPKSGLNLSRPEGLKKEVQQA